MGNAIVDVVLGLVLIYAVLALLVTKVQELLDGNLVRGRVSTLHDLVKESVGQSEDLKEKVLANPLIFALYRGNAAKGGMLRNSGPTAIPPELFARALLIELNGGKHPSEEFATPSAFLAAKTPSPDTPSAKKPSADTPSADTPSADPPRIWKVLAGLLAGREANWADFTGAVAEWYCAIGDRAEGWFKRRAQWWSLGVALACAVLLNVDSLHIARTLSQDSAVRDSFADIAERVAEQRAADAAVQPAATPKAAALAPEDVAAARLTDAIHSLTDAVALDKKGGFATFKSNDYQVTPAQGTQAQSAQADSDCLFLDKKAETTSVTTTERWLNALPRVRSRIEQARTAQRSSEARTTYVNAHSCLSHLSSWLAVAETFASSDGVRRSVRDATVAIEQAKTALLTLVAQRAGFLSLRRSYQTDPEAVRECRQVATTPSEFGACVEQALRSRVRLPILFLQSTMNFQFCEVTTSASDRFPPTEWPCGAEPLAVKDSIGVNEAVYLSPRPNWFWPWAAGVLITALFVALGAPFWFDVLGRVVKLRAAGRVRDEAAPEARAGGKTPPPAVGAGAAPPRAEPPGPATSPFASSRNAFEDGLVARDIVALQQALTAVAPGLQATGQLDTPTRSAIAAWCRGNAVEPPTEELSRELYQRIVGRDAVRTPAAPSTPEARLGQVSSQVPAVAKRLMEVLGFPGRIAEAETRFTSDLRALAVLYRYKRESTVNEIDRKVFALATTDASSLDKVDASLIGEILGLPPGTGFAREMPGWLDWAIGELGQVEAGAANRGNSNPRICEYLDTAVPNAGNGGDDTAWCGAFVAWVLRRHLATLAVPGAAGAPPPPISAPLRAANWSGWATQRAPGSGAAALAGARRGDVVLFQPTGPDSSGHVAFFIALDPAGKVCVLGGNQSKRGCVCLTRFNANQVVTVRGVP